MIYNMYSTPDKQKSIISNEPETEEVSGIIEEDAPEAESEKPKKTTKKKG